MCWGQIVRSFFSVLLGDTFPVLQVLNFLFFAKSWGLRGPSVPAKSLIVALIILIFHNMNKRPIHTFFAYDEKRLELKLWLVDIIWYKTFCQLIEQSAYLDLTYIKGILSGLRPYLATGSPLKMMEKALFILKVFKYLSWLFGQVE